MTGWTGLEREIATDPKLLKSQWLIPSSATSGAVHRAEFRGRIQRLPPSNYPGAQCHWSLE